jgi:hypothetical protein
MSNSIPASELLYIYIIPISTIISVFINIKSAIIFAKPEFANNIIYKYLIANSIILTMFAISLVLYIPQQCNTIFPWTSNYEIFFEVILRCYILRVLIMVNSLINLKISYLQYKTFMNVKSVNFHNFKHTLFVYVASSVVYNIPSFFYRLILMQNLNTTFTFANTLNKISFLLQIILNTATLVIIIILNYKLTRLMKKFVKENKNDKVIYSVAWPSSSSLSKVSKLKAESFKVVVNKRRKNIVRLKLQLTYMVLGLSAVFITTLIMFIISFFFQTLLIQTDKATIKLILTILHISYVLCTYFNILIYFLFNKVYAYYFKNMLKKIYV